MSRNIADRDRRHREALAAQIRAGVLVPARRDGQLVLLPREEAREATDVALDLAVAHGERVEHYDAAGRMTVLARPTLKGRAWRVELLQDAAAAATYERVRAFRRKWGLGVRLGDMEHVRRLLRQTGLFTVPDFSKLSPQFLTHYDRKTVSWTGVAPVYAVLIHELRQRDKHAPHFAPRTGGRKPSVIGPLVFPCRFCQQPFRPKGSVMDCCARPQCRAARRNAARRERYAASPEVQTREKARVTRWRRITRRRRSGR